MAQNSADQHKRHKIDGACVGGKAGVARIAPEAAAQKVDRRQPHNRLYHTKHGVERIAHEQEPIFARDCQHGSHACSPGDAAQ
jgi:hypothetical protein